VAATVDHAVIAVVRSHDADVVVMRDVAEFLVPVGTSISSEVVCRLLQGISALHQSWEGRVFDGLCRPGARYRMFAPVFHASDSGPNRHPARDELLAGWEAFADLVPTDVVDAMFAVHDRAELLGDALKSLAQQGFSPASGLVWGLLIALGAGLAV